MNKRGLYSKLGISVVGISLLMGVPTLIHANELNYGQLSISPIFQGGSYQLNNKSIDISPLLLDKLSGESQTVVMKFKQINQTRFKLCLVYLIVKQVLKIITFQFL